MESTYCIRCGKTIPLTAALYSDDDPDHEEALCQECYQKWELDAKSTGITPKLTKRKE